MVTKEIIKQSISNGTLNPKMLNQFMNDMKIRSFSYDYQIQKDLVNFHEHRFLINPMDWTMNNVWTNRKERSYPVTIKECQMLFAGTKDKYLRTGLFNKYLSPEEVTANMKFFRNSFVVFINGYISTDYRVKIKVDKVEFLFRYKELNKLAHMDDDPSVKLDGIATDVRIVMLPNAINTVTDTLSPDDFNGTNLLARAFSTDVVKKFKEDYTYYGYWINKENGHHFFVLGMEWHADGKYFSMPDSPPTDVTKYSIMVIGMDLIYKVLDIAPGEQWITFATDKMPLPKDDIAIYYLDEEFGGYIPNDPDINEVSLVEYYPNIYQIINPQGLHLKLMAFYDVKNHNNHIYFDNEVATFMRLIDLRKLYEDEQVPSVLQEFHPIDWTYSLQDMFKGVAYKDVDMNNIWDGFLYKMNYLAGKLKKWMLFYEEFQRRTYGFLPGWYHRMSSYKNLSAKIRTSTLPEITDTDLYKAFTEPQYIFSYKNVDISGDVKSFNWFIDGKYTIPTHTEVFRGYQYVYFPTSKINQDSIIEVERFDGIEFSKELNFTESSVIEFKMEKFIDHSIIANSLFFVDYTGLYITDKFQFTIIDSELGEVPFDPSISVFEILPEQTMRIEVRDENVIDTHPTLVCRNKIIKFDNRSSGVDFIRNKDNNINLNSKKEILHVNNNFGSRIRIYTNDGRLLPKIGYRVWKQKNYQDTPLFNLPVDPDQTVNVKVEYIGYDERLVFHRESTGPNGYINLEGRTSRPFSLAYHDVYLDGYRLTKYDIDTISPWSFVITKAAKLKTLGCVEIYEKTHAIDDYVKFEYDEESQYIMDKLVSKKFSPDEWTHEMLNAIDDYYPTIEDGNIPHVDAIINGWGDFIKNYLIYISTNADIRYDFGRWKHLFKDSGRVLLNADDRVRYIRYVKLMFYWNHDLTVAGHVTPQPNYEYDNVMYPYDSSVQMREEDYEQYGYHTTDWNPVFDEDFQFAPKEQVDPTHGYRDAVQDKDIYIPDMDFHHRDDLDRHILSAEDLELLRETENAELDERMDMIIHCEDGTVYDLWDMLVAHVDENATDVLINTENGDVFDLSDPEQHADHMLVTRDSTEIELTDVKVTLLTPEGDEYEHFEFHDELSLHITGSGAETDCADVEFYIDNKRIDLSNPETYDDDYCFIDTHGNTITFGDLRMHKTGSTSNVLVDSVTGVVHDIINDTELANGTVEPTQLHETLLNGKKFCEPDEDVDIGTQDFTYKELILPIEIVDESYDELENIRLRHAKTNRIVLLNYDLELRNYNTDPTTVIVPEDVIAKYAET